MGSCVLGESGVMDGAEEAKAPAILGRNAILSVASRLPREAVFVSEWSGSVLVRAMTAAEVAEFGDIASGPSSRKRTAMAWVVSRCVINEQGHRVFEDGDVPRIGEFEFGPLNRVFDAIARLSGLSGDMRESVAEATGN